MLQLQEFSTDAVPPEKRLRYWNDVTGAAVIPQVATLNALAFHGQMTRLDLQPVRIVELCASGSLKHGMSGAPGLEIWGPVEEGPEIKAALLEAGADFDLRQVGGRAYATVAVESGWLPSPLPAIYTGESMRHIESGWALTVSRLPRLLAAATIPIASRTTTSRRGTLDTERW